MQQAIEELEKALGHLVKAHRRLHELSASYARAGAYALIGHMIATVKAILKLLKQEKGE